MKFSTKEDIDAPIQVVFDQITNFAAFEQAATARGADIQRHGNDPRQGISWNAAFDFRGRRRELELELAQHNPPNRLVIDGGSANLSGSLEVNLQATGADSTRVGVALEIKPKSLSGRLMVQSMRLAKGLLTKRFKKRVAQFANRIEAEARSTRTV